MKCPHCQEDLGLNDICINPACSHFGAIINSSEKSDLNDTENNLDNQNSYNNESNLYTSNTTNINTNTKFNNTNLNPKFNNTNTTNGINYNIDNESINKNNNASFSNSNNISKEEFAAFIGSNNTNYYLDYTDKMKNNNKFLSWNWPCFFLGTYWLLYRKLYAVAAILLVVNISLSLLIPGVLSLIIRIVLSIFANAIYLNHSAREIRNVKTVIANLSATQYINRLQKKGGVNLAAPFILIAIYIVVIIIIVAISLSNTGIVPHNFSSPSYSY